MKYFFTLLIFFIAFGAIAQKRQNVYFFKENGRSVKERDSADFIRIIREPDSGLVNYELIEYYKNGNVKRKGYTTLPKGVRLEGLAISFYKNGKKKSVNNYQQNKLIGTSNQFYENGNLRETRLYTIATNENDLKEENYKTLQVCDTTGNKFLDSIGNGDVNLETKTNRIRGMYKEGYKDGLWTEYVAEDKTTYEELYKTGKFVSGKFISDNGEKGNYVNKVLALPYFKGGKEAFSDFLKRNIKYPSDARANRIEGNVLISFFVEEDGS